MATLDDLEAQLSTPQAGPTADPRVVQSNVFSPSAVRSDLTEGLTSLHDAVQPASPSERYGMFLSNIGVAPQAGAYLEQKARGRMANALAEQIRVARQQGLSPTQAFHELMRSPDFVEAFIGDRISARL